MPMNTSQAQRAMTAMKTFLETPLNQLIPDPSVGQTTGITLAEQVRQRVPAYQLFLEANGIDNIEIASWSTFASLPLLTKANYCQVFPLAQRCWDGALTQCDMVAASSGSTGQPTFWPRFIADEFASATRFEQIFHDSFQADQRTTLAVVCFALGTWVGGLYTTSCCRHLASKGYLLTVIAPGSNKTEILSVVQKLGPNFDQVVLLGYPPFLKDVIDSGRAAGVTWSEYQTKLVMAGEVVSEAWRTLVGQRLGSTNYCFDSASLYGTADAGVLGNETPLSICIRRWLAVHPQQAADLFGEERLPTLVQYDPNSRLFEVTEGTLLFTGDSGVPLIRYHINDRCGLIPYAEMLNFLADQGFDPVSELQGSRGIRPLPFVYVFGRSLFTLSYFGANIYPENIMVGLEQPQVCDWVTGKFVMQVQTDRDQNSRLAIAVELAPGQKDSDQKRGAIADSILEQLLLLNSEFANYVPTSYQYPLVQLLPTADPNYFPVGVKHRYSRS